MARQIDTKFEGKLTCASKTDMRNFANFRQSTSESSKLGLWWDPFVQSWKWMSLEFTGELYVMTMKNDANVKRNWLVNSKLTWGIWRILTRALENLKNLHFNVWAKKVQRSIFDGIEYWCKIWRKTDLCFQKWLKEFGKFSFTGWKIAISF